MREISLNIWLETHGKRIDYLIYELEKYRLSGSYGGNINLEEIITLFKGAKLEITTLTKKIIKLKEKELNNKTTIDMITEEK